MDEAPTPDRRNLGLWVGLGCLGILVLSCCLLTYWVQAYGFRWFLSLGDESKAAASSMIVVGALEGTRKSCSDGTMSEDALPWFHPDMMAETRNVACLLEEADLRTLADAETASSLPLIQTERGDLAERFGMDPSLCFEHGTEQMRVVGCFDPEREADSIPYQIIDLALNPG